MSQIDDFLSGRHPQDERSGSSIDDFLGIKPKKRRGAGDVVEDLAKGFGGAAVSAVGAVPTALGRALQEGGEMLFGLSMDEARRLAEAEGTPEKALEWYEKANRFNPVSAAGRAIESGGRWISEQGDRLRNARSDEAKELARQSTPDGDITKPSTWTLGENPSVEGVAQVAADVVGSMAPPVATAIATRGRSAATQMRAGGATVAGQIGGSAMDEAGEYLGQFDDNQLRQVSPVFRELEAKGYSAADARTILEREAENRAATYAAPVGFAGGQATGALLGKPGEKLAGKFAGMAPKAIVLGVLGATEEGLQEVSEGVATRAGIRDATGIDRSLTEGTFGEFVLGAKGGGATGAGKGVLEGLAQRGRQAPAATTPGTPPAPQPTTPGAPPAPVAQTPATPPATNPTARLAELEILAEQRDLTPAERQEAVDLLTALSQQDEQDTPQGTDGAIANEGAAPEAAPVEAAAPAGGDGASAAGVSPEPVAPELEAAGVEPELLEFSDRDKAPVGAWVKADFKLADRQPVYQVRELDVNALYLPELDSDGRLQPEKRRDLEPYTERAKAGEVPPPITVIEMEDGRLRVVDGHRRVMAARAAGKQSIRALVSPLIDTPAGKQEATAELIAGGSTASPTPAPAGVSSTPKPADFWSFAKSKGYTPAQIKVGTPEHAALKAEYDALKAGKAEPILPPLQPQPSVDLQNRDRSRAASVVQMSDIARNPDYLRLGPSRTPDSGAPMVFAVGDQLDAIAPENFGRQDVAVMSDGQRVPFRYAVVDATKVNPSNFADGRQNPEFNSTTPGTLKALNNGRTAGVRAAHEMGTAGEYVAGMQADEAMHGIPADVIARTPNPMLVRVYSDAANTANMAAKSQGQGLGMSPAELARQDAPLMDSSVLGVYEPGEITSAANRDFVRAFIGKLQAAGQDVAGMMTGDGQLSQDGRKRIQAALMQAAYGDVDLVEEMFDSTDTDIKAIGEALKAVAGQWANMRDSAKLGAINPQTDITQNLIQAIGLIRKARRERMSLKDLVAQPDLMTGETPDALTVGVLRVFYDGANFTRAVGRDKVVARLEDYIRAAMATSADAGLFGGEPVSPADILATIIGQGALDAQTQPEEGRGEPAGGGDPGGRAGEARTAGEQPDADRGGRASAENRGAEPGQDAAPEAQQQVGQGDPRAEEGDGAAAARAGAGRQEGADGRAAAAEGRAGAADGQAVKAKKPKAEPDALPADQAQQLERDFRTFPTLILNNLLERGEASKLYKAAGVKGASAFGDLAMDDKAAAYVKFVQQGGKPVENLPKDYNAWVKSEERAAEVRRLQSDRVVRQENGKPFKSKTSAQQYQERYDLTGTHEVVAVDGGFDLRQLSPAAQAELKRKAEGRESYTEAQAAVAEEMGIGQTPDGEWDATDEQFDEMERRVQERMRGEPAEPLLTNPTREDVLAQQERAENAQAADEREQIRRESEVGAGMFSLEMQDGRQDTTADLFRQPAAAPAPAPAPAATQAEPAPVTYEQHIQRLEDRARRFGRESVRDEARSALASMALAREFGESMEDYLKRNPQAEIKHKAYTDWLDGKAKLPERVPAEASRPAGAGAGDVQADPLKKAVDSAYRVANGYFGRDFVSRSIQNDWQRLLDAAGKKDVQALSDLESKYRKDEELDGLGVGTSGAGPGKVKQARRGAAQIPRFAREIRQAIVAELSKNPPNPNTSAEPVQETTKTAQQVTPTITSEKWVRQEQAKPAPASDAGKADVERRPNLKNGPSSANVPVAPPAPIPGEIPSAQARWDVFMPAERREMLRAAGYTDADQARTLSGLKWVELSEQVRKAVDAAHKKQVTAQAPSAQTKPAEAAPSATTDVEQLSAIERHGLPEGTTFSRGKGLASGKWIARAGDTQGNLSATIDEAASSLAQFLQLEKRREENAADMAALSKKVADKLRRGEQPTDAELRDLFGLDPRHTYVKQSAVGQFLVDYMGVPRNKIRESLGKAAGTVTSDSGTKYPIVYPRKLHEVFGTTKAADDAQAGDKQAATSPAPAPSPAPAATQAEPAPVTYEQHIQRLEDRARRFGRESVRDEARSALASMALAREFGESMEDYLKRNPQAEIKHKAYTDWLDGKAKLPERVPAEASRPAGAGAGDAADPFEGMNLPDQVKEYLLKPSVTLKDGSTVSPKDFVDGLLADGYGNPEYFVAPKGSQAGFLSKPGSPKVTLNDKQMFYADAAFMAKKRAQKKQEQAKVSEPARGEPAATPARAKTPIARLQDEIGRAERKLENLKEQARKARAAVNFAKADEINEKILILQSELKGMQAELEAMQAAQGGDHAPASTKAAAATAEAQANGDDTPMMSRTKPEEAAARRALARIMKSGVTSADDLRDLLRVPGYSQWAQSALAGDVDATRALRDELTQAFGSTDWRAPKLNDQGIITLYPDWDGLSVDSIRKLVEIADQYDAPVALRGGPFTNPRPRLFETAGFVPYTGLTERMDRPAQVMFTMIRPAGGITATTPLFSKQARPGAMTESAVRQVVDTIKALWTRAPDVVVVQNMQDMRVPEAARLEDARQRAAGATGVPRGFYYRGTVYLVADGLKSVIDAAETLFHEALGHYGLRAVFGSALDGILDQIAMARPDLMRPKAKEYGKDLKVLKQRREVAEEVLAGMAQTKPNLGFVKRAIAAIRTWLRQNVPGFKDLALTDDEIINNFILPARGWVERGERAMRPGSQIALSRSAMESVTANIDRGLAKLVYHGTSLKNLQGILKNGLVPRRKKNHKESGDYVYVELSAKSARAWARQAGGTEFAVLEIEVPESQLVRDSQTLSRTSFRTQRIPARLIKGWDVYRIDPRTGDLEYVRSESNPAFRLEQIKSATANQGNFDPSNPSVLFQRQGELDELTGLPLNPDGTVTVYHHTSADKAEAIRKTGRLKSAAEPHVYVTTRREADTGYGDTAVPIRVNPELLQIDDEFPDGRVDYRIDVGRPGGSVKVLVGEYQNALKQASRDTPETIEVDGVQRPTRSSAGQLIHPTEEGIRNFWRWFGSSRVVDEQGRPLVVYHGTNADFAVFDQGRSRDAGVWFTPVRGAAEMYGSNIMPAFVSLRNPYEATVRQDRAEALMRAADGGHDGLIVRDTDGSISTLSVFHPEQIKLVTQAQQLNQSPAFDGPEVGNTPIGDATEIEVDGKQRPTRNSAGQPIHPTEEGIRNFWRWFGSSRVVDEQGRPLVVYHGTARDFSAFDPNAPRTAIPLPGIFFTPHAAIAEIYASFGKEIRDDDGFIIGAEGGNVMPVYLSLQNPARLKYDDRSSGRMTSYKVVEADILDALNAGHDGVIIEGWADGSGPIQFVAFRPEQIKSATGNSGAFDPANPDIRFSRSTLGNTPPTQPQNPNTWQKLKAKVLELISPDAIESLIYEHQDKNIDLKRLRDHIKKLGGTITDLNDAYLGEELYHKRLAKRMQDFLSEELKPLLADMRARGVDMPTLERYLHARHAPEANRVLAERNPNAQMIEAGKAKARAEVKALELQLQRARAQGTATKAIEQALEQARAELDRWTGAQAFKGTEAERLSLSGMSDAEAAAFMGGLPAGQKVHLEALAARVDAMQAKTLEVLEKYGLMDKATLDAWRSTYQFYAPLHRDEAHPDAVSHPIGQGFSTKGDASKRRTGSNEKVTNILAHIAMQREAALTRGEKNRVAKKLYLMAAQNPDPDFWSVDKPPMMKTVDRETGFVRTMVDPTYRNKPNVVMVRIGGKDHAITFNERNPKAVRMAQSIKGADVGDLNAFESIMGKATRWLASVYTQYNPIFGIYNFARDVQAAILQLSTTPLKGQERAVVAYVPAALKGIYAEVRRRRKGQPRGTGQWAKLWEDMQDEGGTTGYRELFITPDERVKALTKELNVLERGKVSEAAHALVDWLSDYNETMENAVRLAAYKVALDQGMSKERAASLAKNLTVNFNRRGRQTARLGAYYAFLNAAIQGTARLVETLRGPLGRKIMLGGVMLGAVNALIGMAMMGGDDGEEDNWEKIPDFVKERSLIVPLGREDYLAIPMPLGYHVFPNLGRKAVEMMMHDDPIKGVGSHIAEMLRITLDAFNPLGGSENLAQMVTPTPFDPAVALMMNRDWTGKPIYREDNNKLDPTPGHQRTKDTASAFSKAVSEALNKITGGTDYQPGAVSVTPDQIDYVIGQITGGLGREILKLENSITAPLTGDELPAYKIPLVGRLYGNTRGPANNAELFYEHVRELNKIENEIRGRARDGGDVAGYMAEEPLSALVGMGNAAENQIRKLRQYRAEVVRRAEPGYQDEVKRINEQMGEVMKMLNQEVRRAKKEAAEAR